MRLKIGSTYQKAVTIIEKLKEGNASIFICGKSGVGKSTLSSNIIRNLLEAGVRIVVIDHRHAVSLPADLEPYVHRQDVSQKPLKLHLFGTSANPADAAASFVDTVASVIRLSDGQKPLLLSLLPPCSSITTRKNHWATIICFRSLLAQVLVFRLSFRFFWRNMPFMKIVISPTTSIFSPPSAHTFGASWNLRKRNPKLVFL